MKPIKVLTCCHSVLSTSTKAARGPIFLSLITSTLSTRPAITLPACDNRAARPESNRQPVRKNRIAGESSDADRLASLGVRQPRPDSAGWCRVRPPAAANRPVDGRVRASSPACRGQCVHVGCCGRADGRTSRERKHHPCSRATRCASRLPNKFRFAKLHIEPSRFRGIC